MNIVGDKNGKDTLEVPLSDFNLENTEFVSEKQKNKTKQTQKIC